MNRFHALAFAGLLGMLGAPQAQLKPSGPGTPPLPPTPTEVQKTEAQAIKEIAARVAAERWLAVIDAGDYGKAWDQCAKAFRDRVTREQWVEGLPKTRAPLGAAKARRVEVSSYKPSLPGMPQGEYVTVRFSTNFEKKEDAQELVTLVYEGGAWRPLGYGV
ncbi:MAG TPA: DUF4019 domain-containing protein [Burkholderiaceae bacterium]|nr:DUF4019 domain-containing protein [Burkholderiaceae bacterium]